MALEILQFPRRAEQEHGPLLSIHRDGTLPSHSGRRAAWTIDPSRQRIPGRLNLDLYAVLAPKAARNHVELQRTDDPDDRLAAAGRHVEHLHQPFLFELSES